MLRMFCWQKQTLLYEWMNDAFILISLNDIFIHRTNNTTLSVPFNTHFNIQVSPSKHTLALFHTQLSFRHTSMLLQILRRARRHKEQLTAAEGFAFKQASPDRSCKQTPESYFEETMVVEMAVITLIIQTEKKPRNLTHLRNCSFLSHDSTAGDSQRLGKFILRYFHHQISQVLHCERCCSL